MQVKNNTLESKTWAGQEIQPGAYYTIGAQELINWQSSDLVLSDIASGFLVVNNGTSDLASAAGLKYLLGQSVEVTNVIQQQPFSSKNIGTKKLYKRVMGSQHQLVVGSNNIILPITYNWAKITGIEIINSEIGDSVSFMVLDTPAGSYSGVPDLQLNQFGFSVALPKDYYHSSSEYDADLYLAMQIKIVLSSISSKTVGINLILNEVK